MKPNIVDYAIHEHIHIRQLTSVFSSKWGLTGLIASFFDIQKVEFRILP